MNRRKFLRISAALPFAARTGIVEGESTAPFGVPIAANMCACVPAEFPSQAMKVDLRAVAEQTGYEPSRWQTAFRMREEG